MPLRRIGTVPNTGVRYGPGSAAHRHSASKARVKALMAKSYALRCVRGTTLFPSRFVGIPALALEFFCQRIDGSAVVHLITFLLATRSIGQVEPGACRL